MALHVDQVRQALSTVFDPVLHKDLITAKQIRNIHIHQGEVSFSLELCYPGQSHLELLRQAAVAAVQALPGVQVVHAQACIAIQTHAVAMGLKPFPQIKNIIAVASGKGGVGKSTTAVNLALALQAEGAQVGMLDADIYGPSLPALLGIHGKPESTPDQRLIPMRGHGLQVMSIGFLIDEDTPMVWRGPMATNALDQLLRQTDWQQLDYLIVDMPPGTGDIQLTLAQKVPVTGAVIVTTPQDLALLDAKKGLNMFKKVNVPILGIVENMAVHICSNCGHAEHIFGEGGGSNMAEQYQVPYLGALPLDIRIRQEADAGCPTVVASPSGPLAQQYHAIATQVAVKVAERTRDMSLKFPTIVVQNT